MRDKLERLVLARGARALMTEGRRFSHPPREQLSRRRYFDEVGYYVSARGKLRSLWGCVCVCVCACVCVCVENVDGLGKVRL